MVQYISDRVLVMYLGAVVELGPVDEIFSRPLHPYTKALLGSRPSMNPKQRIEEPPITGDPPSPINPPSGCRFHTRCALVEQRCRMNEPVLRPLAQGHEVSCHVVTDGAGGRNAG